MERTLHLMSNEDNQPKPGDMVMLVGLPPGFVDDCRWKSRPA
jgi:hypothetical protein